MAIERNIEIKREDISAKSSENYISVRLGCLKCLDVKLDELSTTLTSFLSLDGNVWRWIFLKGTSVSLWKRSNY